jgi:rhamnulokinase
MSHRTRHYLALDLGAESGRGIVGRFDGRKIELEEVYRFSQEPLRDRGTLRWDALSIAAHLRRALAAAAAKSGKRLASLAVDTWGVDYALLDRNDRLLGYPYHYRDARTDGLMESAFRKVPAREMYRVAGIQFMSLNTVFQLFSEARARSGALEAARTLLMIPDFFSLTLGGEKVCEYTEASTSGMLDARTRSWAGAMIRRLGIPALILPKLVEPGTVRGRIRRDVADETGAPADLKIAATASHDTQSAIAAVPAEGGDWAYLSSGTWSLLGTEEDRPILTEAAHEAQFTNEGGFEKKISFLTNLQGLWVVQQLRAAWTGRDGHAPEYAALAREAARARPFGPVLRMDWAPLAKPGKMPEKISAFCRATGQKPPQSRGEHVRCAIESLALAYRLSVDRLGAVRGRPVRRLHIVGGGSRNDLLNQMAADACGVEVLAGPVEATALGSVIGQMIADREIRSIAEGRAIIRSAVRPKSFAPRSAGAWSEALARVRTMELPPARGF